MEPRGITVRPVGEQDLPAVWAVHLESRDDLLRRMGRVPPDPPAGGEPIATDLRLLHRTDPDGFFAAFDDGEARGMVASIVRGPVWFLSSFWVKPGHQGRGIGTPLLDRALAYGRARGARVDTVWASLDGRAQACYVRAGMAPRFPIYRLEGGPAASARLGAAWREPDGVEERIDPDEAAALEATHWGTAQHEEHGHWTREAGTLQVAVRERGRLRAFAYLRGGVFVGPACGTSAADLVVAVRAACVRAPRRVILRVPGPAFSLLRTLLAAGFHAGDLALFMASAPRAAAPDGGTHARGADPDTAGLPADGFDRRLPSGPFLF